MFTIGAFALIFDDNGRILLNQRRDNQKWNPPGGRVEAGEMPAETVVRETLEETGLHVEVERLVGFYGKEGQTDYVFTFLCRVIGGQILPETAETLDCRYFALNKIPEHINSYHLWRILDVLNGESKPVMTRQSPSQAEEMVHAFRHNSLAAWESRLQPDSRPTSG